MQSIFTYLISANSKSDSTNFATVVNSSPTTPAYLKPGVTYTGGAVEKANISVVGGEGTVIPADSVTKANGTTVLNGGTYTSTPSFFGSGDGGDVHVEILSGTFSATVRCGSVSGNKDGVITTVITGGNYASNLYGGGMVPTDKIHATVGGTVNLTNILYGGSYTKDETAPTSTGEVTLNVTGGTYAHNIIGGSRVDVNANAMGITHTVGSVTLNLSGGTFTKPGNNTDPGISIYSAGYVAGAGSSTPSTEYDYRLDKCTVNIDGATIHGAVFGGSYNPAGAKSSVGTVVINMVSGEVDRILGCGWTQTGGTSYVENVEINIRGGATRVVCAGGGNSTAGYNCVTGTSNINVYGGSIDEIYMGGRYNRSIVSCHSVATIYCDGQSILRVSGNNHHGSKPEGSGTRELVIAESCSVGTIAAIDQITIHGNKTLTVTTSAELNKINLVNALVTLPWVILSGADLSGIASVVFAVNGQEVAVTWNADNTVGVLGDTGYTLNVSGNVLTLTQA